MKNLSPIEEQLASQITKRLSVFEAEIERQIYVDIPQRAMQFDALLKTCPLLQPAFSKQLEQKFKELLQPSQDLTIPIQLLSTPDQAIFEVEEFIRTHATDLAGLLENVKRWFYVAVPGGQELDKMQEEMDQVVGGMEEGISKVLENLLYYHATRGKLVVKLQKRKLYDIAKTLVQFDLSQIQNFKNSFLDLYNSLIVAYDATVKNYENVKQKVETKTETTVF
ncbi:Proteasome_activator pa28 beta subunit [Hexamita inflata]|uniref:Proteasome activator pa28 beta subunit n=1 Tax=Hexamita inflata TaxID=28002 RepID=A0AA86PKF3_9EUKA|nr:Proteasome activator pa28 beta subunit [Hexamita inflata]